MKTKHKTIRQNVFETNSSSTHSVTIRNKRKDKAQPRNPLVEEGVIYPSRLTDYSVSFGESSGTVCDTKDKKAAIVFDWIRSVEENGDIPTSAADRYVEYLKNKLGYSGVVETSPNYYPQGDYDCPFNLTEMDDDDLEGGDEDGENMVLLNKMIEVILDEDKSIEDAD